MAEVEELGGMAKAIEAGIPKLRIEESAAKTQARIDTGQQTVVGVNKYLNPVVDDIPMLKVDNAAVLAAQIDKLKRLRAERDQAATDAALQALTEGARGNANLLELAVQAARAKATVGEISDALEAAFGRHVATVQLGHQREAAQDAAAVDEDRADTARSLVAALLGAGQVEPFAQQVEEADTGLDGDLGRSTVERERDCRGGAGLHGHGVSLPLSGD
jgi:hypothetical protein